MVAKIFFPDLTAKKAERKPEKPVEEVVEVREEVIPPLNAPQPSELTTEKLLKQAQVAAPAPTPAPAPLAATPPGGKKKKKTEPNVLTLMGKFTKQHVKLVLKLFSKDPFRDFSGQ